MSIRINIENILKSPEAIFGDMIKKLTEKNIADSKRELEIENSKIDTILFDAIDLILHDLNNEEGYISRLLYRLFRFEIKKNVRREQLIILGSQLKTQHTTLKKDIYRVDLYMENLSSSIKNLTRLKKAFKDKNMFIFDQEILQKSRLYINEMSSKIVELEEYRNALEDRLCSLNTNSKKYNALFRKIPRYHELREDIYLQLSA